MKNVIMELAEAIRGRESHFFVITGNTYDRCPFGEKTYPDLESFLIKMTELAYPQCLTYDIFSGIKIRRGESREIAKQMGFAQEDGDTKNKDSNAELVAALKKAKMLPGAEFPVNPLEVFSGLDLLFQKSDRPTAVIIDYADSLVPAQLQGINAGQAGRALPVALTKWSRNSVIREKGHLIILIARRATDFDDQVLDRIFETRQIRIAKPAEEERAEFFEKSGIVGKKAQALGKATSGLSLKELAGISRLAGAMKNDEELLNAVFAAKQSVLVDEYGDLLEVMRPRFGFEAIGGLEKPIRKMAFLAKAMREGKTSLVPQGALLSGPPGTGKTVLVEAFAKEAGLNFIKPRDLKSMWVGESERRMTRFLDAIRDLAPAVVFIDEFDQNQGQRGGFDGDSGVTRNLFKKMLEVMSDTSLRGRVLWMLATNRPDLIDPAMKRPGRCDLRIPFLPPDETQLVKICQAAFRQYPDIESNIADWRPYAEKCKGYTGADMIEVIRRAWERCNENGRSKIVAADMDWACEDYRPQVSNWKQVLEMTLQGLAECSSESLLPDNYQELVKGYVEELTGSKPKEFVSVEMIGNILRKESRN